MFENEQAQHDLGGSGGTAALARLRMAAAEGPPDGSEPLGVLEQPVGMAHPRLVEVKRIFGEEGFEQAALAVAQSRHSQLYHI